MFARCVLAVCGAVFACAPARADDKPTAMKPAVIVVERFDSAEAATTLRKLFPADRVIAPIPFTHALLVYATETEVEEMRKIIEPLIAKPAAAKMFAVAFDGAKWDDVFAWYTKAGGGTADVRAKPTGTFTSKPKAGRTFTLGEATDLINEALLAQKLLLVRGDKSFAVVRADEKIDPKLVPAVNPDALRTCGRTEVVEVALPVTTLDEPVEDAKEELKKLLTPFGEFVFAKGKWLIVRDTVGNIVRIQTLLETCCEDARRVPPMLPPAFDPRSAPAPMPRPVPPKFTVRFKDAKWSDVLDWYANASDLVLMATAKPTGTFTFTPPKPDQRYTLAEVTDILNDELAAQKLILIRRKMTFFIQAADEQIEGRFDRGRFERVTFDELPKRGRTELVQVVIPVEGPILDDDTIAPLRKMLSPCGSILHLERNNAVFVQDMAGNVVKIKAALDRLSELKPEKK